MRKNKYRLYSFLAFFFLHNSIQLFIFGCAGSLLLHLGFLCRDEEGCSGSRYTGCVSWCAQELQLLGSRVQALQLWHTGSDALWPMGSPQIRARNCAPASAGGFLPTGPPRKSSSLFSKIHLSVLLQIVY